MMLRQGQHFYRLSKKTPNPKGDETQYQRTLLELDKYAISLRVCHKSACSQYVAVINWAKALSSDNPPKPTVYSTDEFNNRIKREGLLCEFHALPYLLSVSDEVLLSGNPKRKTWLDRRDKKFQRIESLTSNELIEKYLYGAGLHEEMKHLVQSKPGWKGTTAYINALNKFIVFGATKNALLPLKWINCGTNSQLPTKVDQQNKRGPKHVDTYFRQTLQEDIDNIKELIAYLNKKKRKGEKIDVAKAFETYDQYYQYAEIHRESSTGSTEVSYCPLLEEHCISYRQFAYHFNKQLGLVGKQKLIVSQIDYDKDLKDRQGSARDGVLGATFRYEIDATVLDLYVRYPYSIASRYSMGRPVLYLVIDVHSSMIVGFYLGFDGPNNDGVSQALANAMLNKVEFAKRYGMEISKEDWPCHHIPIEVTIDNGPEYPYSLIASIVKSEIGVETVNYTAIYRGDFKGTVESGLKRLNNEFVHYEPGAIFRDSARDEQHASNKALWDYEALVRLLIDQIIIHNKTASRPGKLTKGAAEADVNISPEALFQYSLENEMDGGQATSSKDEGRIRWALLKEEFATVREDCIYFNELEYHSEYFKVNGLYSQAKKKNFKIVVKRSKDWTNHIFHKTESGEYIKLTLKNVNNSSPFWSIHWETAEHLLAYIKARKHVNRRLARFLKAVAYTRKRNLKQQILRELEGIPANTRKTIQPGITGRQEIQKLLLASEHAKQMMNTFGITEKDLIPDSQERSIDLDEELYG